MANRTFNRDLKHLTPGLTKIHCTYDVSAGGVVSNLSGNGFASAERAAQGQHRLTLSDKYVALKNVEVRIKSSSGVAARCQLRAETVASTKFVDLGFYNFASPAAAVDPYSCTVLVELTLDTVASA